LEKLGELLRDARERLGLTLQEAERSTRIRSHYLEALEQGNWESLPSSVQVRGFLRNYSEFLGLDTEATLLHYAEALQAQRNKRPTRVSRSEERIRPSVQVTYRRPRWLSVDLLVAGVISLGVLVVLVWGAGRVVTSLQEQSENSQDGSAFLIPTFTPTATSPAPTETLELQLESAVDPVTPTPFPTFEFLPVAQNVVDLRLVVEKRAWVRVLVDGEQVFQGRVAPGTLLEYQADESVEVTTGNGAGVRVFHNGEDLGLMGTLGQAVVGIWILEGAITPTPTVTQTPEFTPTGTPEP
jgi:transcriptional regulator with XRE-family HTH domain